MHTDSIITQNKKTAIQFLKNVKKKITIIDIDDKDIDTSSFKKIGGLEYEIFTDYFIDLRAVYGFSNILDDSLVPLEATQFMIQLGIGIKI